VKAIKIAIKRPKMHFVTASGDISVLHRDHNLKLCLRIDNNFES
jgi:hypothetical protein